MPDLGKATFKIVTDAKDFYRGLSKMEADANAAAVSTNKSFKSVDTQVAKTGKQMSLFGDQVDESTGQLHMFDTSVGRAAKKTRGLGTELDVVTKKGNVLTRTIGGLRSKFGGYNSDVDRSKKKTQSFIDVLSKFNVVFRFLGAAFKIMKWPALIAGAGLATQAVAALTAATMGLVGALGPLAGALAPTGQALFAIVGALKVVKLGMVGMKDATKEWKKELNKSTPETTKFAKFLKGLTPEIVKLRDAAQKPLLAGFTTAIKSAQGNLPVFRQMIAGTAKSVAGFSASFGKMLGSKAFGQQLGRLGKENTVVLDSLGRSIINLTRWFGNMLDAARPLTTWLAKTTEGWTQHMRASAAAGRESGRLATFFTHTREVMEKVFSIVGHLTRGLIGVGKAARPMGMDILHAIDAASGRWEKWVTSFKGQNHLQRYFERVEPAIMEMGRLVSDLGDALSHIGKQPGLFNMVHQLRDMVPVLRDLVEGTTAAFGPVVLETIKQFVRLFATFTGSSGPLTIFTQGLGAAAKALADLLDEFPVLKDTLVTLAGVASMYKLLKIAEAMTGLKKLRQMLMGMPPTPVPGAPAPGAPGAPAPRSAPTSKLGRLATGVGRALPYIGVGAAVITTLVSQRAQKEAENAANVLKAMKKSVADINSTHINKINGLDSVTPKIQHLLDIYDELPDAIQRQLAPMKKAYDALDKRHKETVALFAKGIDIDPRKHTLAEIQNVGAAFTTLKNSTSSRLNSITANLGLYRKAVKHNLGDGTREAKEALAQGFRQAAAQVQASMDAAGHTTKRGLELIDRYMHQWLAQYGIKGNAAASYIAGQKRVDAGTETPASAFHRGDARGNIYSGGRGLRRHAGGAVYVGGPGRIGMDNVPAMLNGQPSIVANGEIVGVFNRHQQAELDQRTSDYGGLAGFMNSVNKKHYMASGGTVSDRVPRPIAQPGLGNLTPGSQARLDTARSGAQSRLNKLKQTMVPAFTDSPGGTTNVQGVPVANWIAKILRMAMSDGVNIQVSSGYRSTAKQASLYYGAPANGLIRGVTVAAPGTSNHEGTRYPRGAVDLSSGSWQSLQGWLAQHPNVPLKHYSEPRDPYHFSASGHARGTLLAAAGGALVGKKRKPVKHSRAAEMDWLQSAWAKTAPLFHRDARTTPFKSLFSNIALDPKEMFVGVGWEPGAYGKTPDLSWPSWIWNDSKGQKALPQKDKLKLFIHEMAHRFQKKSVITAANPAVSEGGAEAFARWAMDSQFGGIKRVKGDPYNGYTQWAVHKKGEKWISNGQFKFGGKGGATKYGGGGLLGMRKAAGGQLTYDDIAKYNRRFKKVTRPGQGEALPVKVVRAIMEWAGFSPGRALQGTQIAHGESGYRPGVMNYGGDGGTGLLQMTPVAGGWGPAALKMLKKLGGIGAMRNPFKNAQMAKWLYDNAGGWGPWKGTRYLDKNMRLSDVKSVFSGSRNKTPGGSKSSTSSMSLMPDYSMPAPVRNYTGKGNPWSKAPDISRIMPGGVLREGQLGLAQARGEWSVAKKNKLTATVPEAIAKPLTDLQSMWKGRYARASAIVRRLAEKQRGQDLGKKGRAKLANAMSNATTALQNISSINDQIATFNDQYAKPDNLTTAGKLAEAMQANAELNNDPVAQKAWAQTLVDVRTAQYKNAMKSGDPEKIAEAVGNLATAKDGLKALTPTALDFANSDLAVAQLTPDITDNIDALTKIDKLYKEAYDAAVATGDPAKIAEAATNYSSAHEALSAAMPTREDWLNLDLSKAGQTPDIADDIATLTSLVSESWDQYQEILKTNDPRQIQAAFDKWTGLKDQLTSMSPTARDWHNLDLARAGATADIGDDISAMTTIVGDAWSAYQSSLDTNDPRQIQAAFEEWKNVHDQLEAFKPTQFDWADLDLARAEATDDLADDITAWTKIVAAREAELAQANATNDPRAIAAAIRNLTGAQKSLKDATDAATPTTLPDVVTFANLIPENIMRGWAQASDVGRTVTVQQYFAKPPTDDFTPLRSAEFAATAVFGGGA